MAGKGQLPPRPDQEKRSVHFRLPNALWQKLSAFCTKHRLKKQELFEEISKAMVGGDFRIQEVV